MIETRIIELPDGGPRGSTITVSNDVTIGQRMECGDLPEGFTVREFVECCSFRIQSIGIHGVTPPRRDVVLTNRTVSWVLKAEEDENNRYGDTSIKCSGQDI